MAPQQGFLMFSHMDYIDKYMKKYINHHKGSPSAPILYTRYLHKSYSIAVLGVLGYK